MSSQDPGRRSEGACDGRRGVPRHQANQAVGYRKPGHGEGEGDLLGSIWLVQVAEQGHAVEHHICVSHIGRLASPGDKEVLAAYRSVTEAKWQAPRDEWWHAVMKASSSEHEAAMFDAEVRVTNPVSPPCPAPPVHAVHLGQHRQAQGCPPLHGRIHDIRGDNLQVWLPLSVGLLMKIPRYSFDAQPSDVYWCTADIGWITGHSYVTYGPLLNTTTSVLFEGTPFHPSHTRCWQIIAEHRVSKFYTAPTAIRSLMKFGPEQVAGFDLTCLKVLGTVGEPINPEAWLWYNKVVGQGRCSISDTYWQTETGGHILTPLPGATPAKPGSACFPFFGVVPHILDEEGKIVEGEGEGYIVFSQPWPGIMRTVYGDQDRSVEEEVTTDTG